MKYIYALWLCMLFQAVHVSGQQDTVQFTIDTDSIYLDEQVCVPVRAIGFDSVQAFQLSIHFDPFLLLFDSFAQLNPEVGLSPMDFGTDNQQRGRLTVIYFDALGSRSVPDSTILFSMCFTAYGPPSDTLCPINFADDPINTEVIKNLEVVPAATTNGRLFIGTNASLSVVAIACPTSPTDTSGVMEISVYGGVPPYFVLYQHLDNGSFSGGFGLDSNDRSRTITDLISGRYRVTVTDDTGERVRDTLNFRSTPPIDYQVVTTLPACDQDMDGMIRFDSIMGGFSPLQFKWSDGQLFDTERSGLSSGTYRVTITDFFGCRQTDEVELNSSRIDVDLEVMDELCLGAQDGAVLIRPDSGQVGSDGQYALYYQGDTLTEVAFELTDLGAGTYEATVVDTTGCQREIAWIIQSGFEQELDSISVVSVGCEEDALGAIYLRMSVDTTVIFDFISEDADSVHIEDRSIQLFGLDTGAYTITAMRRDSLMCTWDTTIRIEQLAPIFVNTTDQQPASCTPSNDGRASIEISGGLPFSGGTYDIRWSQGDTTDVLENLAPGTYTAEIRDSAGCVAFHEVQIEQNGGPVLAAFALQNMRCDTIPSGVLLTTFTSVAGIASYAWSTGDETPSITNLTPGTYDVTVTTNDGCVDSFSFDAAPPPGPRIFDLGIDSLVCHDDSTGGIRPIITAGIAPITQVVWNDTIFQDTLLGLSSGIYRLAILDNNGCEYRDTVVLDTLTPLTMTLTSTPVTNAPGTINVEVAGGVLPYTYSLSPGLHPDTSLLSVDSAGVYEVEVTDANGCSIIDTVQVEFVSSTHQPMEPTIMTLAPNPARDHLDLYMDHSPIMLQVVNRSGAILWTRYLEQPGTPDHHIRIPLDGWSAGHYLLIVMDDHARPLYRHFIKL